MTAAYQTRSSAQDSHKTLSISSLKPTSFGWALLFLTLISWILAVNYSNNLLYAVLYLWISIIFVTALMLYKRTKEIEFIRWRHTLIFAKQSNDIELQLNEARLHGQSFLENEHYPLTWFCNPIDLGNQNLVSPNLTIIDEFGLWQVITKLPNLENITVLAQPKSHVALTCYHDANPSGTEKEDISGFKLYQMHDDYKDIDWNATARSQQLTVKQWEGIQQTNHYALSWQNLSGLSTLQKQETLTAWILDLQTQGQYWSLQLPDLYFSSNNSVEHRNRCLFAIAEVKQ